MNLILLGAPGAGKGTQADLICEHLNIPAISTGNILREAIKNGTELGKIAKDFIAKGQLVTDDVVIGIIKQRLSEDDCNNGFILDGFPRSVPQAEALDSMGVKINSVIDIEVSDEKILTRLSGRRVCSNCGASYHIVYNPSKIDGKCDKCGADTIQRKDDELETVKKRLQVYHEQTKPLIDYYQKTGKLKIVEGQEEVKDTTALTFKALED